MHCCKVCIGYCQKCAYKYSGEYIATHKIVFHRIVHWAVKRWEETSILAPNAIYYNVHLLHCTLGTLGSTMNQCSAPKLSVHKQHTGHLGTLCTLVHTGHTGHPNEDICIGPWCSPGLDEAAKHSILSSTAAVQCFPMPSNVMLHNAIQCNAFK